MPSGFGNRPDLRLCAYSLEVKTSSLDQSVCQDSYRSNPVEVKLTRCKLNAAQLYVILSR